VAERKGGALMTTHFPRCLIVLAGAVLSISVALSCASSKQPPDPAANLRAGIGELGGAPERTAKMLATVDDIEAAVGEASDLVARERAELVTLLRDYSSTRAEAEASLAGFNDRRDALMERILAAHVALKSSTTPDEWKKLRKLEMEMIRFAATKSVGKAPTGKVG
jgi:hypothetical protein